MDVVKCAICNKLLPTSLSHQHHTKPQAAGGKEEHEKPTCAGCHANVHALASMMQGPRAGEAADTVRMFYQDNKAAQHVCMDMAKEVIRWMTMKKTGQLKPTAAHEDVEVIVVLPAAVKRALMTLGRDSRDPVTNRRLGLAGLARSILTGYIVQKFPALKQEIQASQQTARREAPEPSRATMQELAKTRVDKLDKKS